MCTQHPDEISTFLPPKAKFFLVSQEERASTETTGRRFLLFIHDGFSLIHVQDEQ
jgi:hypothetical protein